MTPNSVAVCVCVSFDRAERCRFITISTSCHLMYADRHGAQQYKSYFTQKKLFQGVFVPAGLNLISNIYSRRQRDAWSPLVISGKHASDFTLVI